MSSRSAQNSFSRGITAFNSGDKRTALAHFEAAIRLDHMQNPHDPCMKYLSYYGLLLSFASTHQREALGFCREAASREFYNPEILWNLGRVAFFQGDRRAAFKAFRRGLEIDGAHQGLRFHMRRLGIRCRPLLPFLSRTNPVNRWAGHLRANLHRP